MRRPPKTAKVLRKHAQRRAIERYGVDLTNKDMQNIIRIIQTSGGVHLVDKQSNTKARYLIPYKEKEYLCIYDNVRKAIVTFLPKE